MKFIKERKLDACDGDHIYGMEYLDWTYMYELKDGSILYGMTDYLVDDVTKLRREDISNTLYTYPCGGAMSPGCYLSGSWKSQNVKRASTLYFKEGKPFYTAEVFYKNRGGMWDVDYLIVRDIDMTEDETVLERGDVNEVEILK